MGKPVEVECPAKQTCGLGACGGHAANSKLHAPNNDTQAANIADFLRLDDVTQGRRQHINVTRNQIAFFFSLVAHSGQAPENFVAPLCAYSV